MGKNFCSLCRGNVEASLFSLPNDPVKRQLWLDVLPRNNDMLLKAGRRRLCAIHFREEDIQRVKIVRNKAGAVVAEVGGIKPRLKDGALPRLWLEGRKPKAQLRRPTASPAKKKTKKRPPKSSQEPGDNTGSPAKKKRKPRNSSQEPGNSTGPPAAKRKRKPRNSSQEPGTGSPAKKKRKRRKGASTAEGQVEDPNDTEELALQYRTSDCEELWDDDFGQAASPSQDYSGLGEEVADATSKWALEDFETLKDLYTNPKAIKLPPFWNRIVPLRGPVMVCFSLLESERDGINQVVPVFHKNLSVDENGIITCSVLGMPLDIEMFQLPPVGLKTLKHLEDLILEFDRAKVCEGSLLRADPNHQNLSEAAVVDFRGYVRHRNCDLLVDRDGKCRSCKMVRRTQLAMNLRHERAAQPLPEGSRIIRRRRRRRRQMPIQWPLQPLKKPTCTKLPAQIKKGRGLGKGVVGDLLEEVCEMQLQMASMNAKSVEDMLAQLPSHQQTIVTEIVAASKVGSADGRKYAEDWILLCLLLRIRSPASYVSLRENHSLPLPYPGTIRRYLDMINAPCGFDPYFFGMFMRYLKQKPDIERHGVILFEVMSVRKSLSVWSKSLTYQALIDFGEENIQEPIMEERATHALVLMFQPLAAQYTQVMGVFASKGSVKWITLAQIIIKAIFSLEKCGAKIHGLVSDGAQRNSELWSVLGISGELRHLELDEWNNSFQHPVHPERRIFVFHDTPQLVKAVRDRLCQEQELVVHPNATPAKWQHFVTLHEQDLLLPDELRVCPKITSNHLVLSSSTKKRVSLAIQIFSKSVADGLEHYAGHGVSRLDDCQGTVSLCRVLNAAFDALNRKVPHEGVAPGSEDYTVLQTTLQWLNNWEKGLQEGPILLGQFLSSSTAEDLRVMLQSTIGICQYLKDKFEFKSVPSGRLNQDAFQRFFGTVRLAAGSDNHPARPTFLQLYKILSVYSLLKPPKCGNCSIHDNTPTEARVKLSDLKEIFSQSTPEPSAVEALKEKLTQIIETKEWEFTDIVEHDYTCAHVVECLAYYVTGYLAKQISKYTECDECRSAFVSPMTVSQQVASQLASLKGHGKLIHPHTQLFHFIRSVETCFAKYSVEEDAYERTVEEVLNTCDFSFPCNTHKVDTMAFAAKYYLNMRMNQWTREGNMETKMDNHAKKCKKDNQAKENVAEVCTTPVIGNEAEVQSDVKGS